MIGALLVVGYAAVIAGALAAMLYLKRFAIVMALANMAVYLLLVVAWLIGGEERVGAFMDDLAFHPVDLVQPWRWYAVLTAITLHAVPEPFHIFGNTVFLIIFGLPLEERTSPGRTAGVFFIGGALAHLAQGGLVFLAASGALFSLSEVLGGSIYGGYIGASGAIAAVMGAMLLRYPDDEILMPLVVILTRAPVWVGVILFLVTETVFAFWGYVSIGPHQAGNIAHSVHILGVLLGMLAAWPLIPAGGRIARTKPKPSTGPDLAALESLVKTPKQRELFERVRSEEVPGVRDAWAEKLIQSAHCPKCGRILTGRGGRAQCPCGFRI